MGQTSGIGEVQRLVDHSVTSPAIAKKALALIFLTGALTTGLASSSEGATVHECGSAGTLYHGAVRLYNVTSRGVSCRYARHFARALTFSGGAACDEDLHCTFRGWRCTNRSAGRSLDRRCIKSGYVVRFQSR